MISRQARLSNGRMVFIQKFQYAIAQTEHQRAAFCKSEIGVTIRRAHPTTAAMDSLSPRRKEWGEGQGEGLPFIRSPLSLNPCGSVQMCPHQARALFLDSLE